MPPEQGEERRTIRIASWNCHGSVGTDGRCDRERTIASIERLRPDVLALQEVDGRSHLGRKRRAFEFFRERLGGHVVDARTVRRSDRDYGHLLWSRWPIDERAVHVLPGRGLEERAAIEALIDTGLGPVRFFAFHFGLLPWARGRQAGFLAERARRSGEPVIAMGDGNEWRAHGGVDRILADALPVRFAPRTWPSRWPAIRMDRMYGSSRWRIVSSHVDAGSRQASDHLALAADLALAAPESAPEG